MSPGRRRLITAWLVLMALTAVMTLAADVRHASRLGGIALIVTAAVATIKSRLVLGAYLGLRSNRGVLDGITAAIVVILMVVSASFVLIQA